MKKTIILLASVILSCAGYSQNVYTIKADSIRLDNDSGNNELIIENSTRNVPGFLFNKGNGRTEFREISNHALTFSTGLTRSVDTITNNFSTGISGGQTIIGGTASGNNLTLSSTADSTKGKILFGTSAYDEVNDRLGIGTISPTNTVHISGTGLRVDGWFEEETTLSGVYLGINPDDNTPRICLADGTPTENWQMDNHFGTLRWYLPHSTQMTLSTTSLTLNNKIISATGTGNNYFAGNIGIGLTTPTALLHLNAGTSTSGTAPLKLTSGTNLTTPEDGAVEYDGTHFFGTIGSTRYQLDQQISNLYTKTQTDSIAALKENLLISINTSTSTYSLILTDAGKLISQNVATANTVTVPPNSSVAFPVGTKIMVNQYGAGQVSISEGAGVTINSPDNALKVRTQFGTVTLIKIATDTWILNGDISN